jgi:hypothetical protein
MQDTNSHGKLERRRPRRLESAFADGGVGAPTNEI